jgi:hypothetical protein
MSKVKIQGNASGTGVLTVTAPNTSTDRTITLPDSTGTLVDNTTAVTKDASGNVGIGVTPETDIPSLYKALQINGAGSIYAKESGTDCRLHLSSNASMNSSYDDKYIKSSVNSSTYIQSAGTHTFQTAASGSADGTISWTTGFEVLNDGKARAKNGLLFGTDTTAANALDDYEEGTWTPALVGVTGSFNTSTNQIYTKIGRFVTLRGYIYNATSISDGNAAWRIGGLPFAPMEESVNAVSTYSVNIPDGTISLCMLSSTASQVKLVSSKDNDTSQTLTFGNVGGGHVDFTITYMTNA